MVSSSLPLSLVLTRCLSIAVPLYLLSLPPLSLSIVLSVSVLPHISNTNQSSAYVLRHDVEGQEQLHQLYDARRHVGGIGGLGIHQPICITQVPVARVGVRERRRGEEEQGKDWNR